MKFQKFLLNLCQCQLKVINYNILELLTYTGNLTCVVCDEDTKCFIYELARSLTADHDDDANAKKNTGEMEM